MAFYHRSARERSVHTDVRTPETSQVHKVEQVLATSSLFTERRTARAEGYVITCMA